jgi:hypothetical protein
VVRLRDYFMIDIPLQLPLVARTPRAMARELDELLIQEVTKD